MGDENINRVRSGLVPLKTEALRPYGLCRSTAYALMYAGKLEFTRIGGRRFVTVQALHELAARNLVPATA